MDVQGVYPLVSGYGCKYIINLPIAWAQATLVPDKVVGSPSTKLRLLILVPGANRSTQSPQLEKNDRLSSTLDEATVRA